MNRSPTVSYTHLDVYKRQAQIGQNAIPDIVGIQLLPDLLIKSIVVGFAVEFIIEIGKFLSLIHISGADDITAHHTARTNHRQAGVFLLGGFCHLDHLSLIQI